MPYRWLFLTGAPTLQQLQNTSSHVDDNSQGASTRWVELKRPVETSAHEVNDGALSAIAPAVDDSLDASDNDNAKIQAVLLEKSRLVAEESYQRSKRTSLAVPLPPHHQGAESQEGSEMEYSESLLPPPTQRRGDFTVNQTTTEESLVNLPNWSFSLSSLTRLDALSSVPSGARVNLLALVSDLEPPSAIPLKKPSRTGKFQAIRASLSLLETSGATLDITMWDDYAEKWAGETLMTGDVVYLEKIALIEYRGKRQGSTIDGSRVQICYRTLETGRKEDRALRPDLGLGWDQASVRVKALVDLAASLG